MDPTSVVAVPVDSPSSTLWESEDADVSLAFVVGNAGPPVVVPDVSAVLAPAVLAAALVSPELISPELISFELISFELWDESLIVDSSADI